VSRCRSCGAEIVWATTEAGKAMPLDAAPTVEGNVAVTGAEKPVATVLAGLFLEEARSAGRELFMPHHATCPQGRAWRKKK
jgi:hypothetical protein